MNLKGKNPAVSFVALVNLNGNALSLGHYLKKKPGVELALEASGTRETSGISIDEAYLVIDKNRIPAKGSIKDDGKAVISINLPPQGIPTSALIPVQTLPWNCNPADGSKVTRSSAWTIPKVSL